MAFGFEIQAQFLSEKSVEFGSTPVVPGTIMESTANAAVKRKRQENGDTSKKRRKSGGEVTSEKQTEIEKLETEVLESRKNYNHIAALISLACNPETNVAAAEALCRVFISLLAQGKLVNKQDASEKDATVTKWLRDRLKAYHGVLFPMVYEKATAIKALMLIMALVKAEALHLNGESEAVFPLGFFMDLVAAVLQSPVEQLRTEFTDRFFSIYDDIRFYTLDTITQVFAAPLTGCANMSCRAFLNDEEQVIDAAVQNNAFNLLVGMRDPPESSEELEDFYVDPPRKKKTAVCSPSQHKKTAQKAWLAVMQMGLSKEQKKKALEIMATSIAPWFSQPEMLMDFLTDCYNSRGSTSLLALSGVFYLIQQRNLDYPSFYTKLYSLLDADILHSKYRSRFFRLLDTFLRSSHLPAVLVASFVKRLARLALNAPPSAIVAIVPWFYNVFKKHPLCTFMMHRVPRTQEERDILESEGLADPFLPDEEDPMKTRAIDSCIWEIVQLQSHYHPNVATIAKIVSEQFTKQYYGLEDFLDHSYSSVS